MKRILTLIVLGAFLLTLLAGCGASSNTPVAADTKAAPAADAKAAPTAEAKAAPASSEIKIGIAMRRYDDTFLSDERNSIVKVAEGKASLDVVDCQASQATQNDKVDMFITKKVNSMGINLQDRQSAGVYIDKAKVANIPVVFFNCEPLADDMKKWDKVLYVGAKAEESGTMQGQIMLNYWKSNPDADKNKDGVMQYVMLKGDPGNNDAEMRTKYSIQAITDAGIKVQKLGEDTANWDRVKGQEKMAAFLAANGDKIEAVFANNDDMALGAIEALKAAGYFNGKKYMPVVGVDATVPGLAALKDGSMLGTVLNDAKNQGTASFNVALALAKGQTPSKDTVGYEVKDGKYIWIPYKMVTKENMNDVK